MSETLDLFKAALGLGEPWRVTRSDFDVAQGRLDLYLDFPRGARFGCAVAGCDQGSCPVHDTEAKTWRHMDFFQYKAFLHARVPRTRCPEHGVHLVEVAWARPESGFTLLFEALLIEFATAMPVARVAAMTREHDTRIWRVLEHHVAVQREKLSFADVRRVGMDETSARKGQDYVTTFMDLDARRVLFATEGRDSATVAAFAKDLTGCLSHPAPPAPGPAPSWRAAGSCPEMGANTGPAKRGFGLSNSVVSTPMMCVGSSDQRGIPTSISADRAMAVEVQEPVRLPCRTRVAVLLHRIGGRARRPASRAAPRTRRRRLGSAGSAPTTAAPSRW